MLELFDVRAALLDNDGSFRDLNFEHPSWDGVSEVLNRLSRSYETGAVTDANGDPIAGDLARALPMLAPSGGHASLQGGHPFIERLQVFVSREDSGAPWLELSFHPRHVIPVPSLRDGFIEWLGDLQAALEASRAFARYESVAWELGNTQPASGVFLVLEGHSDDP